MNCLQVLLEHDFVNGMRTVNNKNGDRPLHYACRPVCRRERTEAVQLLLPYSMDHLNDPNSKGETALHIAVQRGVLKVIRILLDTGEVDLYQRDGNGRTVFEMAKKPNVQSLLRSACGSPEMPMGITVNTGSSPDEPESVETSESMDNDNEPTVPDRGQTKNLSSI